MCSAVIDSSVLRCQLGSLLIVLFKFSLILLMFFFLFTSSVTERAMIKPHTLLVNFTFFLFFIFALF